MTGLDWGTVPAWASAILTSGSLLLGFHILLRDRKKEERKEALALICWVTLTDTKEVEVHILNTADRPFSYPEIIVRTEKPWLEKLDFQTENSQGGIVAVVRPDEEFSQVVKDSDGKPLAITFRDSDGARWMRHISERHLYRLRNYHVVYPGLPPTERWKALRERRALIKDLKGFDHEGAAWKIQLGFVYYGIYFWLREHVLRRPFI